MSHAETVAHTASKRASAIGEQLADVQKELTEIRTKVLPGLLEAVNGALTQLDARVTTTSEFIEALASISDALITTVGPNEVGIPSVMAKFQENRAMRLAKLAEDQKKEITTLLAEGKIKSVEAVTETSLIAGMNVNEDGTVEPPGHAQNFFYEISDETIRNSLLGKKVGEKMSAANGKSFEITGIYERVETDSTEQVKA